MYCPGFQQVLTYLSHYKVFSAQHGISTSKVNLDQVPANSRKPTTPHPAQQRRGRCTLTSAAPPLPCLTMALPGILARLKLTIFLLAS